VDQETGDVRERRPGDRIVVDEAMWRGACVAYRQWLRDNVTTGDREWENMDEDAEDNAGGGRGGGGGGKKNVERGGGGVGGEEDGGGCDIPE
jgi:hypothetical protein